MKRIVYALLLAVLAMTLAGCGKTDEEVIKEADTVGGRLAAAFFDALSDKPDASAQEVADIVLSNEVVPFPGATVPVEEGLLTGFGNAEITGFSEGVMFVPMIGSIPFVGYVFTLPEGADGEAFMKTLTENADPRWNICTEADETVVRNSGNKVFFLMCPSAFEE